MILAAGLGTRLKPLTNDRPKALVKLHNRTLLDNVVQRLADAGVTHCVVNVHAFGDKMIDYIASRQWPVTITISDERNRLLDTGGALKHAAHLFSGSQPVLIHNVDVVSDIDIKALMLFHQQSHNLVTLCVSRRESKRMLLFNEDGLLVARQGDTLESHIAPSRTDTACLQPAAFSGVSVVSPELFDLLPPTMEPYPIIPFYLQIKDTHRIGAFWHSAKHWHDVGTPEKLTEAEYSDIIDLPHHISQRHQPMPLLNRAAQFAPFAALTGYDDAIDETAQRNIERIAALNSPVDDDTTAITYSPSGTDSSIS